MKSGKGVILIIMDGWGHGRNAAASAIAQAQTPNIDSYYAKYPHAELRTDGAFVGLPEGQMGNSEVGHLNLGAGRIVYQELERIGRAIRSGELAKNQVLRAALEDAKNGKKNLHFIGLVSDGGVHSHIEHLLGLLDITREYGVDPGKVFIHAFTDGRDCDPKSGLGFLKQLETHLRDSGGQIASVIGRYYAMDRDKRWERTALAYDLLVHGKGKPADNILQAVEESYKEGITDEFIKPIVHTGADGKALATIRDEDVVICFNFRTDRCRQITRVLTQEDFPDFGMHKLQLHYVTMTIYDHSFKNVATIFDNEDLKDTLGEVLEKNKCTQLRIAETEKYPHVTFFISGGREKEFEGESRIMIPSPKVATYDLQPEMSAFGVKDAVIKALNENKYDFICLNFANADMVGHTGVFSAAVKACETVDTCVGEVVDAAMRNGYAVLLTADHGNSDFLINADGTPNTAHTKNPVPIFYITQDPDGKSIRNGKLGDVAPSILKIMGLDIPEAMHGEILPG